MCDLKALSYSDPSLCNSLKVEVVDTQVILRACCLQVGCFAWSSGDCVVIREA